MFPAFLTCQKKASIAVIEVLEVLGLVLTNSIENDFQFQL